MASGQPGSQRDQAPPAALCKAATNTKKLAIRPAGDFLWVDYQNDHLKNRELLRYRQAFVRSRHHRLRREKAVQQFSTATEPFPTEHSPPSTQATDDHSSRTHRHRLAKCDHSDDLDRCRAQQTPLLVSSPQAGVLDGGPALAVSPKQSPNIYFHHYRVHSARSCFPLCSNDVTVWFWKKALEDPTLMQIKLSISASHRAAILTASGASTAIVQKPAQDALRLRVGTIKSLRYILQDAATVSSEETIFVIAHIIVSEAFEANSEAAETHMNGLKKIIDASGGMNNLGYGTLSMLYCCEFLRGIMKNSLSKLEMCTKFQNRVLKESSFFKVNNNFTNIPAFGARFFTAPWSKDIHPTFKSIIFSFQQLISYYENSSGIDVEPMSVENDCLLYLSHRLQSLPFQCPLTVFEESLRLSILAYSCVRIWSLYGIPCLGCLIETLQKSLLSSFSVLRSTAPDLLFWILFIGSLASKGMKPKSWFLAHLRDIAEQLSVNNWDNAVSILRNFFFVCRPSDEPAKELWESNFRAGMLMAQVEYI